ncbi:hypothetical protein pb186bvf_010400 [Paramecium bursaria]
MLPILKGLRSSSLYDNYQVTYNIQDQINQLKKRKLSSHYAQVIVNKLSTNSSPIKIKTEEQEQKAYIVVMVYDEDQFLGHIMKNPTYLQFIKSKEYLNNQQLKTIQKQISDLLVSKFNQSYSVNYCSFKTNDKEVDLEHESSKDIYELLFEFAQRKSQEPFKYIFSVDFQLIHKSKFRTIFYLSKIRLDFKLQLEYLNPNKQKLKTSHVTETANTRDITQSDEHIDFDMKMVQVGNQKRNKMLKDALEKNNKESKSTSNDKHKYLIISKQKLHFFDQSEDKLQTLDNICELILTKFRQLFRIYHFDVDQTLFSQFLLLSELTMMFSKNKLMQRNIQRLDQSIRFKVLVDNILYLDFKILKSMNQDLQVILNKIRKLNDFVSGVIVKFIKQIHIGPPDYRIFWTDFIKFKIFIFEKQWNLSDLRLFLLLIQDSQPSFLYQKINTNIK